MSTRATIEAFEVEFRRTKSACERAMAQLDDAALHVRINPQQNSIAAIVQHLHGNMVSRWTDFPDADGEKPTRDREDEFVEHHLPRLELTARWEQGWLCLFDALAPLADADLSRTVTIRNEPHTVALAIARQIAHYGWHAGQIVLIAKHLAGDRWSYLTIPPGGSAAFNQRMGV